MSNRIDRLKVTNFQSVENADLKLGAFTVFVGPSNSGKSALLRALKAVVRNSTTPASVRVGKKSFAASAAFGTQEVAVERGASLSTYRILQEGEPEEVYTKAGRTVPEDVQRALGLPLPEGPDLVFSSQIDPPFLLAETGTVAAKMLGDLTNVSKLHAASREANRLRLEASKVQKIRAEDAEQCLAKLKDEYSDLPARSAQLKEAREKFDSVQAKARRRDLLQALLENLKTAELAVTNFEAQMQELPTPVDIESLAEAAGRLLGKQHLLRDILTGLSQVDQAEVLVLSHLKSAEVQYEEAEREYDEVLSAAGTCPTCGKAVA